MLTVHRTLLIDWLTSVQNILQLSFIGALNVVGPRHLPRLQAFAYYAASTRRNTHPPTILIIIQSISFFRLPRSIASSLFKLRAWQSFCTTSFHVLFGLPLGLEPSTSYSIHFFTKSVSSFRSTCPYHRRVFCCGINIISPVPSLYLNFLLGTLSFTLTLHIHLTILISAR